MSALPVVLKPLRKVMPIDAPVQRVQQWSQRDTDQLTWYFGLGQTAFERSVFGGMLDRAQLFGGIQHTPVAMLPVYDSKTGEVVIGRESALSARPTAELHATVGYVPDDGQLQLYAIVSTRMMRVERTDRLAAQVIELLFGDAVQRWSGGPYGRLGSLFVLTAKGKALVTEAAKAAGAIDMTAAQRIESLCAVQAVQPKPERAEALAVCMRQSEALEVRARMVWHQVRSNDR